jgi:hypothetical protein
VVTIGPGDAENESASVGTAAHIHSAALNGPRGRGLLTTAELANIKNGIWCCATHGREIDTNRGRGYTVETLQAWKRIREEDAKRNRTGLVQPIGGWVDEICIVKSPLFKARAAMRMSKAVAVSGAGATGKTALLEWIALSLGEESDRWKKNDVSVNITSYSPAAHRYEFSYSGGQRQYVYDDKLVHSPPSSLRVVHVRDQIPHALRNADDLAQIAHHIGVKTGVVRDLVPEIQRNGTGFLETIEFIDEPWEEDEDRPDNSDAYCALYVTVNEAYAHKQSFGTLSGSELRRVILEFALALARERSREAATMLLLDSNLWSLDKATKARVAKQILEQPFQTILVIDEEYSDTWHGWSRYRIERRGGKSSLRLLAER